MLAGAPGGADGFHVSTVPSTAPTRRHGGASSMPPRPRCRTAAYSLPSALTGASCCCAESQALTATGMLMQLAPPHTATGLFASIGLPVSSSGCVIWTYSPAFRVSDHATDAAPAGTPSPPA